MSHQNRFVIHNNLPKSLDLYIEPEGALFPLGPGDEVFVSEQFTKSPVTITLSKTDTGDPQVSIWPGDGDVRVEKGGVNVFDLLQERAVGV